MLQPALLDLQRSGYAICENVFSHPMCAALRAEIQLLHEAGKMHLNSTHLVRSGQRGLLRKVGIWEAEVGEPQVQDMAPLLGSLQGSTELRTLLSVYLPHLALTNQAIKAQLNEGQGACFPMHVDSDDQVDRRRISAIFYLSPNWDAPHGGALRLFPYGESPVDIAPLQGRMVLFASTHMLHRVMPSYVERLCFTLWMSDKWGSHAKQGGPSASQLLRHAQDTCADPGGALPEHAARDLLRNPEIQKLASKLRFANEWAESIRESHADDDKRKAALEQLWADHAVIESAMKPLLPILQSDRKLTGGYL